MKANVRITVDMGDTSVPNVIEMKNVTDFDRSEDFVSLASEKRLVAFATRTVLRVELAYVE